MRRRKLANRLLRSDVKYIIDLTPLSEGEEAVYMTTEMCCSDSVRLWYQAGEIWKVSQGLVGGPEEYSSIANQSSPPSDTKGIRKPKAASQTSPRNAFMPLEYSPVRHRSAIERVIAALIGLDPKLDSAPKVWTTFAVARYYGITHSPLTDFVIRWLRAYPNSFFLEVCPEICLRIADGFENHDLARDAFAILVGEEALECQLRSRRHRRRDHNSHGRRKEDLPEVFLTRIEYASKSLLDRVSKDFMDLAGGEMAWLDALPEVKKLSAYPESEAQDTIVSLKRLLKDYVRGTIYKLLCTNFDDVPSLDFHQPGGEDLIQRPSLAEIWSDLSINERIVSRTFWKALLSFNLFRGPSNFHIGYDGKAWGEGNKTSAPSPEEMRHMSLGTYRDVHKVELLNLIHTVGIIPRANAFPRLKLPSPSRLDQAVIHAEPVSSETIPNNPKAQSGTLQEAQIGYDIFDFQDAFAAEDERAQPISDPRSSGMELPLRPKSITKAIPIDLSETPPVANNQWHANGTKYTFPTLGSLAAPSPNVVRDMNPRQGKEARVSSFREELASTSDAAHVQRSMNAGQPQNHDTPQGRGEGDSKLSTGGTFFSLGNFFNEARQYIKRTAESKLRYTDCNQRKEPHEIGITNTLVCLSDDEWKYLPLWAGGLDDGSGGVFNDHIPGDQIGFCTPGPEVHSGFTPANSEGSSEFEVVHSHHSTDTFNTSMANNRSVPDTMYRGRVYAADSIGSSTYEDFDMMTIDSAEAERTAGRKEAQLQKEMPAESIELADHDLERRPDNRLDENYSDVFGYEEEDLEDMTDAGDDQSTVIGSENGDEEDDDMVMVEME